MRSLGQERHRKGVREENEVDAAPRPKKSAR
jgi:hypothetical protein